jgi:hypothetical protein
MIVCVVALPAVINIIKFRFILNESQRLPMSGIVFGERSIDRRTNCEGGTMNRGRSGAVVFL